MSPTSVSELEHDSDNYSNIIIISIIQTCMHLCCSSRLNHSLLHTHYILPILVALVPSHVTLPFETFLPFNTPGATVAMPWPTSII